MSIYHAEDGQPARLARAARAEDSQARAEPWFRDRVVHPADVGRHSPRRSRFALSGAASHDGSGPDQGRVAAVGRRTPGARLRTHAEGTAQARGRPEAMARGLRSGGQDSAHDLRGEASWGCGPGLEERSAAAVTMLTSRRS